MEPAENMDINEVANQKCNPREIDLSLETRIPSYTYGPKVKALPPTYKDKPKLAAIVEHRWGSISLGRLIDSVPSKLVERRSTTSLARKVDQLLAPSFAML